MTDARRQRDVDRELVRQISWAAVVVTVLLALFAVAMLQTWPFPDAIDWARGPFYVLAAVVLLFATLAITFLGYRIVTMRVVRHARSAFLLFMPAVFLISTIVGFLLLTAPR